jgi:hypothetical protein
MGHERMSPEGNFREPWVVYHFRFMPAGRIQAASFFLSALVI